jgi:hypothetical protein
LKVDAEMEPKVEKVFLIPLLLVAGFRRGFTGWRGNRRRVNGEGLTCRKLKIV